MNPRIRKLVHNKYSGHCAYCGKGIPIEKMQVDHIIPIRRGMMTPPELDDLSNINPACGVCNRWKTVYSIEECRIEIAAQTDRIKRDSAGYRMAFLYKQVVVTGAPVIFYFEMHQPQPGWEQENNQ